jgi:dUTP pyrophosphatase
MFSKIDSHLKAYMLGIHTHMFNDIPDTSHIKCTEDDFLLCTVLGITIKCNIPALPEKTLIWSYIRGYFDRHGLIIVPTTGCKIVTHSNDFAQDIGMFCNVPFELDGCIIQFAGINAIDFLGNMYKDKGDVLYDRHNYEVFIKMLNPCIRNPASCMVFKTDIDAVIPSKGKYTDVGYDLTAIKKASEWNKKTTLYDTCIKIKIEPGFYAEVVPRSSLSKSGYMLANSIGIIDPNYTGNILIALVKIDDDAPDLELPFRCCQLIFRKHIIADIIEVSSDFNNTVRGQGCFGSSG